LLNARIRAIAFLRRKIPFQAGLQNFGRKKMQEKREKRQQAKSACAFFGIWQLRKMA
jgi:hypothetical protein